MKRNTTKKIFSAILVAAMSLSLLVGCGGSEAPATTEEAAPAAEATEEAAPAAEATEATEAASGDVVTLNVTRATFNLATPDSEQVKKVEDAVNAYIADKGLNVQIVLTDIGSGEYTDKANLALANNEINLLWTASWEAVIGTNDLVPQNAVYDLTDLLPGTALYESMDAGQWEATKYNGKNYFIPVYKDNVEGYDVMFRQDLVDKYGWDLSSVKSLADIEPMLADDKREGVK